MTTLEVLKAARELISDEKKWTQGQYARDATGSVVGCTSEEATCFCSDGALGRIEGFNSGGSVVGGAWIALRRAMGVSVCAFNDTHTHAEVLAKFDEAIAKLEAA